MVCGTVTLSVYDHRSRLIYGCCRWAWRCRDLLIRNASFAERDELSSSRPSTLTAHVDDVAVAVDYFNLLWCFWKTVTIVTGICAISNEISLDWCLNPGRERLVSFWRHQLLVTISLSRREMKTDFFFAPIAANKIYQWTNTNALLRFVIMSS